MLSRSGAGFGAKAFNTSLNLSIAIPRRVHSVKSVKRPSEYVPSSAIPIDAVSAAKPLLFSFTIKPSVAPIVEVLLTVVKDPEHPPCTINEPPPPDPLGGCTGFVNITPILLFYLLILSKIYYNILNKINLLFFQKHLYCY